MVGLRRMVEDGMVRKCTHVKLGAPAVAREAAGSQSHHSSDEEPETVWSKGWQEDGYEREDANGK